MYRRRKSTPWKDKSTVEEFLWKVSVDSISFNGVVSVRAQVIEQIEEVS